MARLTTREKQSRKASRSKAQKKRLRSLRLYIMGVAAILLGLTLTGGSWWLLNSGWVERVAADTQEAWHAAVEDAGFGLQHVYIEGREKTGKDQVLTALGVGMGDSMFATSPEEIKKRLESLGTVREAMVERALPDTLRIRLRERVPVAVWQMHQKLHLIDEDGVALSEEVRDYPNLLVVVGADAPKNLAALLDLLKEEPELAPQVVAAIRVGERRWNLKFSDGVEVMLPESGTAEALQKLAEMQRTQGILKKSITAIDMRLSERVFIKLTPDASSKKGDRAASET